MYRKTYLEINENILKANVENIIKNYSDYNYYFGVVKGNAYGHGMHIVNALIDGGINYLAVSSLEEALEIRKYNKDIPILCFGYIDIKDINECIKNNITVTIISFDYFKRLIQFPKNDRLKVHIKVNTGLNRLGLKNKEEIKEVVDKLKNSNIYLEGIYTHYATSGVTDIHWDKQTEKFEELTSLINLNDIPIVHTYDSLSLVKHKRKSYLNGVRLGIVIYGYSSNASKPTGLRALLFNLKKCLKTGCRKISETTISNNLSLKKCFNLYSEVISIFNTLKGETIGYHAKYVCDKPSTVAIIPIGYADGITKYYKYVKINNQRYSIVSFSMDYIMVLIDGKVKQGDKVTILGDDVNLSSVASSSQINVNQVLVSITNRVPRVHIYNKKETEIKY